MRWFDRRSRYFPQRMVVIGAFALLSTASVVYAFGGGEDNPIGARVLVVDTGFGIAIALHNESETIWRNVRVQLEPGGWIYRKPAFRPKERFSTQVHAFEKVTGKGKTIHPDRNFRPRVVRILTDQGAYEKRFGPGTR